MKPTLIKCDGETYKIHSDIFAYDGCHKIYILEDDDDLIEAQDLDYRILPIEKIENTYNLSCPLKFISTWKLESVCPQCETPEFIY